MSPPAGGAPSPPPARRRLVAAVGLALAVAGGACVREVPRAPDGTPTTGIDRPDFAEASRLNTELGFDALRKGDIERAFDQFNRALEQNSSNRRAHQGLALIYDRRGDFDKAREAFRESVGGRNPDPSLLNLYGAWLCARGDAAEGLDNVVRASKDPSYDSPESALLNAGICARILGDYTGAENYQRRVLEARPADADALGQLAWLSAKKGDWLRTRAFLGRYAAVGKPTAETLGLAVLAETALGDNAAAARAGLDRRDQFPDAVPLDAVLNPRPPARPRAPD